MKRLLRYAMLTLATAGLLVSPHALAQEMYVPQSGETPVGRIQEQCDTILPILRRLHTSDALLRVNIGQVYNGISERLMARLNSRLALNRIDSSQFVEITGQFESDRSTFASSYNRYESSLSSLVRINCKDRPAEFYAALITAREARQELSAVVRALNSDVRQYQVAVENLLQGLVSERENGED